MIDTLFDWNEHPEFLIGAESLVGRSLGHAAGLLVSGGMTVIGRSMSNAVDRTSHTPYSLTVFLNTRVYAAKQANKRSRYWWG